MKLGFSGIVWRWLLRCLLAVNILFVVFMLTAGYSGYIHPMNYPRLSTIGLIFPYTLIPIVFFLFFWIFVKPRYLFVSFIALILAYSPMRSYWPVNFKKATPDKSLKVVSFNVMLFAAAAHYDTIDNEVLQYVLNSDADIICLQEAETLQFLHDILMNDLKKKHYYVSITEKPTGNTAMLISKFPILGSELVEYESEANLSVASRLLYGGDTLLVINNHLESIKLSDTDKQDFSEIVHRDVRKNWNYFKEVSLSLESKIAQAGKIRSSQAEVLAHYIDTTTVKDIIVCGDFNDHPNSFTAKMLSRRLTDCYREAGNGVGFTYQQGDVNVRIDHIFCSKTFSPYEAMVDNRERISDHYPISCKLVKNE